MYRTKEKERERAKWASLDLRAMRVGDRCHARRSFFYTILYLQGGKLMTRNAQCNYCSKRWEIRSTSWNALHIPRGSVSQGLHILFITFSSCNE